MSIRTLLAVVLASFAGGPADAEAPAAVGTVREAKFELFVTDVAEASGFYRELGFEVAAAKPDGYTTLRQGAVVIALSPVPGWVPLRLVSFLRHPPLGTEIVLYTDDLEGARGALAAADHDPGEIELQPWGDRDFRVTDPDGYYVRISEGTAVRSAPDAPEGGR